MPGFPLGSESQLGKLTGGWRVDPARSHASFTARARGRTVRGRLPLAGDVRIAECIEDSVAFLSTRTRALSTGVGALDRLLKGPSFLDSDNFPQICFWSQKMVRVPDGWRALGRLRVKAAEHELACELEVGAWDDGPAAWDGGPAAWPGVTVTTRWALDSEWVTSQRLPGLGRCIAMTCSLTLEPATSAALAA
jgi:polyisoprenoid-binding protein YceI